MEGILLEQQMVGRTEAVLVFWKSPCRMSMKSVACVTLFLSPVPIFTHVSTAFRLSSSAQSSDHFRCFRYHWIILNHPSLIFLLRLKYHIHFFCDDGCSFRFGVLKPTVRSIKASFLGDGTVNRRSSNQLGCALSRCLDSFVTRWCGQSLDLKDQRIRTNGFSGYILVGRKPPFIVFVCICSSHNNWGFSSF